MDHTAQAPPLPTLTWKCQGTSEGFSAALENYGNLFTRDTDAFTTWDSLGTKVPRVTGIRMSR